MDVELQAICSALGYQEGSKYLKEPDCLESVKDLIRCLRRDDDTCCIRRQLGQAEIVQSDLLPLIKEYKSDRSLFETVIRLLLNLTQPARLCFGGQIPEDKVLRNYYMEVESILRNYKKAFVDDVLFAVLTEKLTDLLKLDWEHRHEEDRVLIERLLILVRNVLHVQPDANEEKRTDDDASIHDQVLWSLHVSGMEDLLLYVSNSADERQYCMHTLEIVTLMFRQQTPALLASAGVQRAISEKEKDVRELEIIREQERIAKQKRVRYMSTRHSRFGGTYVLKNVQSISDREVIFHGSLYKAGNHSFDITKKSRVTPKNRAPITQVDVVRRSTLSIRLCLKEFCVQFLENCYNPLMSAVKDNLVREVAQDHDETYYLWALRFFMEFCRLHSQQVELISETLSVSAFHYIQVNLFNYYEMITTDKKEAKVWAKRVHLALKAYQELLMTLHSMETSKNKHLVSSAKVLKGNIFYMMEFRDIFVVLLSKFDHSKYSTSYLTDLVHATHLFLKMLEISQKSNRCIVVQKKKKASQKSKSSRNNKNNNAGNSSRTQLSEEELLNLWDDVSSEVSAVLSGENEMSEGVLPFDAASEVDIDQQRADTMVRIQTCLRSKNPAEAVALLRAAREVWPDNNEFGSAEMSPEDEFLALREVFMANLSQNSENMAATVAEELEEQEDDIVEEEMSSVVTSEEELSTRDFIAKFAKPAILQSYTTLLANFKNNSAFTNHCIIKMFHRIAVDLHQEGMFFQARLFCIFREAFALSKVKHFQEIVQFGVFIVRKFFVVAEKNKKIFMEMLFWKTAREAGELSDGYFNPNQNVKQVWTEDQEMELKRLFDEAKEDPEKDIVGHIMAHLTDETKSRGQVLRQLRISGLIQSAKDLKRKQPPSTNSDRAPWTEEQETELRDAFERFRGSDDPLGNTMQNLSFTKPKNKIKDKLFGLDIVQDKKELYKKRSRRKKQGRMDGSGESGSNSDSNDDDDCVQEGHVMATHSDSSGEESDEVEGTRDIEGQPSNSDDLPSTDIEDVLKCLVSHDYKGPISWIQRSLRRTAEDRQTPGTYVGVPVVPLTEENEEAMEDPIFLDFLLLIGLSKPITGQEAFWRITGDLDGSTLTMIADGLNLDENGQPTNTAELKTWLVARSVKSKTGQKQNKSKKEKSKTSENNGKRKKALMALQKKQTKDKKTKGKNKAKSSKNNDEDKKNSKKQRRTKKKKISENSEEENGDSNSQLNVSGSNSPKFSKQRNSKENKKKKRRRIEFEDSSDEDDVEDRSESNARNGSIQIDDDDESGDEPLISQVKSKQNADDDSDDDSDVPLNSLPTSKKKINQDFNANCSKRKETPLAKFNSSDSDSDDGRLFIETELENFDTVGTSEKKKKKKKRLLSDSSDEDAGNHNVSTVDLQQENDDVSLNKEATVPQLAGPSFVKKTKKRQKLIDSESSDGGHSGKTMEELDDSAAERKTVNGSKRQKIAILESSDDDSGDEDKENHEIDSTKELNPKQDDVDLFDKAKSVQTPKYVKQNPNIINNNTVDTFPATLLSLPNMEPDTNVFDDHIPLVTAIRRKRVLSSDDEND